MAGKEVLGFGLVVGELEHLQGYARDLGRGGGLTLLDYLGFAQELALGLDEEVCVPAAVADELAVDKEPLVWLGKPIFALFKSKGRCNADCSCRKFATKSGIRVPLMQACERFFRKTGACAKVAIANASQKGGFVPVSQRQLAASLRACAHIVDREAIASFLRDPATQASNNPFQQTSAGAQRTTWTGQSFEFRVSRTQSLGLGCLLQALDALPGDAALVQEIFAAGPYRAYVYHRGDGCQIIGAVLHGRGPMVLPAIVSLPRRRTTRRSLPARALQLDLFAFAGQQ